MRLLGSVAALVIVLGAAGCGSHEDKVMPNVTGVKLDIAKSDIKNAGFDDKVKVDGGGLLGVWDDSNWTVCAQVPTAGQPLSGTPELTVDRSCRTSAGTSSSPSESGSNSSSPSPAASTPEPTEASEPAASGPITPQNNKDFAALLKDPSADCDNQTRHFADKYYDDDLEFNGKVSSVGSHNGDQYEWDVLVYHGENGPNFQFSGVDNNAMHLPESQWPPHNGEKWHIVADIEDYDQPACLLELTPVSTKIIH